MAMFGWGVGFYGPSIFLHTVVERTSWSLALVSTAVTVHYLFGALVITRLPVLHRRFGIGPTAVVGAACTGLGVLGWSVADAPWQLFASALISGAGWVTMGAVAVNAAITPWYARGRPMALAKAYNGASIGGVVFSPLWVLLIAQWGFTTAAVMVGLTMFAVMVALERADFARTPERLGQCPDGDAPRVAAANATLPEARALAGRLLWRDRGFVTLTLGMAAGLFAQIGLLAHLFSLLVPALGAQAAGLAMGFATACAIGGRLIVASVMPSGANRRNVAALAYGVQLVGSMLLLLAEEPDTRLILIGVALFGSGIGNATSLPPLIAQSEFAKEDVPRVVALIAAIAQATYAFAPATFGLLLSASADADARLGSGTSIFFLAVAAIQGIAILSLLAGRREA
jgi:MFS family permease